MTTSRITSGEELKHRNGEGGLALDLRGMAARYQLPHRSDRALISYEWLLFVRSITCSLSAAFRNQILA
jgi:hypothetical protein